MRVLVDTNVLLRRVHHAHPQNRLTRQAMTRIAERGNELCVASQNLIEFWAVCTRPLTQNGLGLLPAQASSVLLRIESSVTRLADDPDRVYPEWRKLVTTYGVSGKKAHDARLVAAMNVHGITHIVTFNVGDFGRYVGIVTIDPRTSGEVEPT